MSRKIAGYTLLALLTATILGGISTTMAQDATDAVKKAADDTAKKVDDATKKVEEAVKEVVEEKKEEAAPEPEAKEVTVKAKWVYDAEGLKGNVDDADEEDGVKEGTIYGDIFYEFSDGSTQQISAIFTQTLKDGKYSTVTAAETGSDGWFNTHNLWIMIAAALVFIMHLGFATVESGFCRAKNTVNILFKNTLIPCIGLLMYAICGWLIMYPGDAWIVDGVFAFGFGIGDGSDATNMGPNYYEAYTMWTDFLFQGMFAATAATIVSGAVCERIKLFPFLIFSVLFVGISYPITGSWKWGGGWLDGLGFYDFAGSTLVHAVGGMGALVGAAILGPRLGKYAADGTVQPIPGHNLPLATIGVFLLWLGWFGFNGGSVLSADAASVSLVLVTTAIAAAAGGVAAGLTSSFFGKPDLSMALNGVLAGLVGITAGADQMGWVEAAAIGAIAGVIVYFSVLFFDKIKIDDPVGAISVHLVCGIWGTLAVGIFGAMAGGEQLVNQAIGVVACCAFTAVTAGVLFIVLKAIGQLRVSAEEELEGLDLGEHGMSAYPDFQRTYIKSYHAAEV